MSPSHQSLFIFGSVGSPYHSCAIIASKSPFGILYFFSTASVIPFHLIDRITLHLTDSLSGKLLTGIFFSGYFSEYQRCIGGLLYFPVNFWVVLLGFTATDSSDSHLAGDSDGFNALSFQKNIDSDSSRRVTQSSSLYQRMPYLYRFPDFLPCMTISSISHHSFTWISRIHLRIIQPFLVTFSRSAKLIVIPNIRLHFSRIRAMAKFLLGSIIIFSKRVSA